MRAIEPVDRGNGEIQPAGEPTLESERTTVLVRELVEDLERLVKHEATAARTELRREVRNAAGAGSFILIGAILGGLSAMVLAAGLVLLLAEVVAPWLAAIIIAGATGIASALLVLSGRSRLGRIDPKRAVAPIREDGRWIREKVREIRSNPRESTSP